MKVEVYTANLRRGGAVVTASAIVSSVVDYLDAHGHAGIDAITFITSPQVMSELPEGMLTVSRERVQFQVREDSLPRALVRRATRNADVRFVVFGPDYVRSGSSTIVTVCGFADGTLIQSWRGSGPALPPSSSRKRVIKALKMGRLKSYDGYIVQTNAMAFELKHQVGSKPVLTLPNLISPAFKNTPRHPPLPLPKRAAGELRLLYPARGYPHKNHSILDPVSKIFTRKFGSRLTFVTTLNESEWNELGGASLDSLINVGAVGSRDLPSLYEATDGLFFPSLNETFSASPLEAAFMRRPILACDLPFNRELLDDKAFYFSPDSTESAADLIHEVLVGRTCEVDLEDHIEFAKSWVDSSLAGEEYAAALLCFLTKVASVS